MDVETKAYVVLILAVLGLIVFHDAPRASAGLWLLSGAALFAPQEKRK